MNDPKRAEIKARIAAAQARDEERPEPGLGGRIENGAAEASGKVTSLVKAHPVATVAGAVVAGVLVASLFKGPRRAAVRTGAKAASLASLGSEMALAFAAQLREDAEAARREGERKLDDLGDTVSDTARTLRREADYRAGKATDRARIASRDIGKAIARKLGR
jgi:hypothetical protein